MSGGHWLKDGNGNYHHYTDEEYDEMHCNEKEWDPVLICAILGFLFLIFSIIGKDEEAYLGVALWWGLAAFLWLRNRWLDYRFKRRCEESQNKMKKEEDEWKKNFIKKNGREPSLGDYLDRIEALRNKKHDVINP